MLTVVAVAAAAAKNIYIAPVLQANQSSSSNINNHVVYLYKLLSQHHFSTNANSTTAKTSKYQFMN